jgi:hypothetical protein
MIITVNNADFSGLGLGTTVNWVDTWATTAGISDQPTKNALRAFYDSCIGANIWTKLAFVAPYVGSTYATQKFLFENKVAPGQMTINGNPLFTSGGFKPNGAGCLIVPYSPPDGAFTKWSMGVWNGESETLGVAATNNARRYLIDGTGTNTGSVSWRFTLARRFDAASDVLAGMLRSASSTDPLYGASNYDSTKTGFLQYVRNDNSGVLLDSGSVIATRTDLVSAPTGGSGSITLGGNVSSSYSTATQKFAYGGFLTVAEAQTFQGIVATLVAALGR